MWPLFLSLLPIVSDFVFAAPLDLPGISGQRNAYLASDLIGREFLVCFLFSEVGALEDRLLYAVFWFVSNGPKSQKWEKALIDHPFIAFRV
jgi:hypothetical protein